MKAIVTRPRDDAATLVGALADRGVEALLAPMLTILPVPQATRHLAERLAGAQAVLFTSANGVRAFAAASPRRGLPGLAGGDGSAAAAPLPGFPPGARAAGGIHGLVGDACRAMAAVALSPAVAAALGALSWRTVRVAARPGQGDLLAALDAFLAERPAQTGFGGA